jgi:hypothetical protein
MSAARVSVLAGLALAISGSSASGEPGALREARGGVAVVPSGQPATDGDVDSIGAAAVDSPAASRAATAIRAELADRGFGSPATRDALEGGLGDDEAAALADAARAVADAREAYATFEYDRALARLEAIDRLLIDREPSPAGHALLVERHLLAGLVHEGRGRTADATRSFRALHHLAPARRGLDAGAYRPQVVALFARVVKASEPRAPLRITAEPAGAAIWLDGRRVGKAPLALAALAGGPHWVVASAPGQRPRGVVIDLDAARPDSQAVSLSLSPLPPAEVGARLRRRIAQADRGDARGAAGDLARLAGVDVLVLIRARGDRAEGAVLDARSGLLSAWLPAPSEELLRQLPGAAATGSPAIAATGQDPLVSADPRPTEEGAAAPAWYGTWWGRSILVAGGLAIAGGVVYAVSAGGDDGFAVGGFCFDGKDC